MKKYILSLIICLSLNASENDDNNGKNKINANAKMARDGQGKKDKWVCPFCNFGSETYPLCFDKHTPISNWAHRKCPECLGDIIKSCDQCCQQCSLDDCRNCFYFCQAAVSIPGCYYCCKFLCALYTHMSTREIPSYCEQCLARCPH